MHTGLTPRHHYVSQDQVNRLSTADDFERAMRIGRRNHAVTEVVQHFNDQCQHPPRAISPVGCTMSPIRSLTMSMLAAHKPVAFGNLARCPILPCLPTMWLRRSISLLMRSLSSTTSLNASAISPSSPVRSMGSRTEKFPFRNALRAARRWRPLRFVCSIAVRLPIDVSQPLSPNWSLADTPAARFGKAIEGNVGEACISLAAAIPADSSCAQPLPSRTRERNNPKSERAET